MYHFFLDTSAWVKRYITESGTPSVSRLFDNVPKKQISASILALGELESVLIRKKNSRQISETIYLKALSAFYADIIGESVVILHPVLDDQVWASIFFIQQYFVNATDAIILRCALDMANILRPLGDDLVLVTSDIRLANSARLSNLMVFDPERNDQPSLEKLMGNENLSNAG